MKLIAIALACVALSLVVVACTETAPATNSAAPVAAASPTKPADEFAATRASYQKNCEGCHSETGEGGNVGSITVSDRPLCDIASFELDSRKLSLATKSLRAQVG